MAACPVVSQGPVPLAGVGRPTILREPRKELHAVAYLKRRTLPVRKDGHTAGRPVPALTVAGQLLQLDPERPELPRPRVLQRERGLAVMNAGLLRDPAAQPVRHALLKGQILQMPGRLVAEANHVPRPADGEQ